MSENKTFEQVVELWGPFVKNVCRQYCHYDPLNTEECYQNSLLRIWLKLHTFRGEAELSSWLYRITANECLMFRRRNLSRWHPDRIPEKAISLDAAIKELEKSGDVPLPFETVALKELRQILIAALKKTKHGETLIKHILFDEQSPALSKQTGYSLAAVKSQIYRDKEIMRRAIKRAQNG